MSHFTVLVIGENPEDQLAPYHEFECTGQDDQYIQDIDETESVKEEFEKNKKEYKTFTKFYKDYYGREVLEDESKIDLDEDGKNKYGYAIVDKDGNLVKAINRTNPNAKWDWYSLGGRWTGFFELKEGAEGEQGRPGIFCDPAEMGSADSAYKKDIDFDGMKARAKAEAEQEYDKYETALAGETLVSFENMKKLHLDDMDATRAAYNKQQAVINLFAAHIYTHGDYQVGREKFIQNRIDGSVSTFAVVKDGKWYEKGEMGWWAIVSNEKDEDKWRSEVANLIDSASDDTLLSVYDCHI